MTKTPLTTEAPDTEISSPREAQGVTRRSFVAVSVGALVALPAVTNGLLLPAQAIAAETGQSAKLVDGSTIYIVRPRELALVVQDVSLPEGSANLLSGATVKVTSRYNGKSLQDSTDENGSVVFDIGDLAENGGKQEKPAVYEFNATIEVSAPGYRNFRAPLVRVEGGSALGVPTQPRQDGVPYPVSVAFDEWDVLYTTGEDSQFASTTANTAIHTIGMSLQDCPAGAGVTASVYADGKQVSTALATAASDGTANLNFYGKFLQSGSTEALPIGDDHAFTVRYTINDTTYEVPIKPSVTEAPPEAEKPQVEKDLELTPFNDSTMFLGITVPDSWPLIGGTKYKIWEPDFIFNIAFDPYGFIRIAARTPSWGYEGDDPDEEDENAWQFHPRKTFRKQYRSVLDRVRKELPKAIDALDPASKINQIDFTEKVSISVQAELMAAATWDTGEKDSRGRASLGVNFGANYSLLEMFWAGPLPMYIRFGLGLNGSVTGSVAFVSPSVWTFSKYRWDYSSTGLDISLSIPPTLSVGIGIAGVSSISLKGSLTVSFYLHAGPLPDGYDDRPNPHLRLAFYAALTAEAEFLFFTQSYEICSVDVPDWWDNWKEECQLGDMSEEEFFKKFLEKLPESVPMLGDRALEGMSLAEVFNSASIIGEEALEAVAEFKTDGVAGMNAEATQLTRYELGTGDKDENGDEKVVQLYLPPENAAKLAEQLGITGLSTQSARSAGPGGLAAGASPALITQANGVTLKATGDSLTQWKTEAPELAPIGNHYEAIPEGKPGVSGLGAERGVMPGTDICIAHDILASSRFKLFSVNGNDYIARLGVVMVNGKPRTRVIAECIGAGTTWRGVLDFGASVEGVSRDDCFDYDFDIFTEGTGLLSMVVISGTRGDGDSTAVAHAAGSTFFNFVTCYQWSDNPQFSGHTVDAGKVNATGCDKTEYPYRNYSCPQICQIADSYSVGDENRVSRYLVVTYLERAAKSEDELMGTDAVTGVGLVFFNKMELVALVSGMYTLRKAVTGIGDPTVTEISFSARVNGWHVLMLKGTKEEADPEDETKTRTVPMCHYVMVQTDACSIWYPDYDPLPEITDAFVIEPEQELPRLVPVESLDCFFACIDGTLKRVDVESPGSNKPTLAFSDFGDNELNMSDFGVTPDGTLLYWPAARDNGGYAIDENGEAKMQEDGLDLIMGARILNDKLSRPFALCEVKHPTHRIRSVANTDSYLSFISSVTKDSAAGKGEQWYTAIPWVRCATLVGAAPTVTTLAKGDELPFYVALRNDGNCYLSGVELTVAEVGGEPIGIMHLVFGEDTLLESEWNPRGEDGKLINVEDDWALAPGTSARYCVGYVTIPEEWEGEKTIEVTVTGTSISNAEVAALSALKVAESKIIEFLPELSVENTLPIEGRKDALDNAGILTVANVTVEGSEPATQVMYRLYNPNSGEHFYTASVAERNQVAAAGWNYEGIGWTAPVTSDKPVYRLYSGTDHHYTASAEERDGLVKAGWKDEGIGWYSADEKDGVPLYRQFNPNVDPTAPTNNSGSHNYTTNAEERDGLVRLGWKDEGIGWYGV